MDRIGFWRDGRGSVGVMFALMLVPLLGVTGVAVDYSRASAERARLQNEVDAAVLAGAAAGSSTAAERAFASLNPEGAHAASFTLQDNVLTGHASARVETALLRAIAIPVIEIGAAASAEIKAGNPVCLLVRNPNAGDALKANSGVTLDAPDCEVHVRAGTYMDNAGAIRTARLCTRRYGGNNARPVGLQTECDAVADPFAGRLPAVSVPTNTCATASGKNYDGKSNDLVLTGGNYCNLNFNGTHNSVTFKGPTNLKGVNLGGIRTLNLQPGIYEGINLNSGIVIINLAPGLYIWKGNTDINSARLTGEGVTIYYPDANSRLRTNSGGSFDLAAPQAGTYAGILFFEKDGLASSAFTMDGGTINRLEGLIYLPSRHITFNSSSKITSSRITMVVDRLTWNGGMVWSLAPGTRAITATGGQNTVRLID